MPDETTILSLPLILPAQAQKHVTHNEAILALDLIVQLTVINRTLTTAPALPTLGDRHIVAAGATGPWAGQSGRIALFSDTGWQFTQPLPGWRAHVLSEQQTAVFDGLSWKALADGPLSVTQLGVSATADAVNRLTVSAPATLLNHAGSGHQLKLNKAAAGDTASLLFQTGFSGRAEMGTAGSDDFSVKVSADGASFATALEADAATGEVTLPQPLHLGGQAADPSSPSNGTMWLNTTSGEVKVRSAGVTLPVGGGGGVTDGDKGDITVSGGGASWAIDAGVVTLGKLASMATDSFLGRDTAGTGSPEVLTPAQATALLPTFTSGAKGLAPASGGGTGNFLRADGSWAAPATGGSPGGAAGEIQWNNAGTLAGAANVEIEGGQLRLGAIATPAAPASGGVKLFGRSVGGRILPAIVGPSGLDTALQPILARNKVAIWTAQGNAGVGSEWGINLSTTGAGTNANVATTNLHSYMQRREWLVTTASTTAVAGFRGNAQTKTVGGPAAALGGFHLVWRWAPATGMANVSHRAFAGMRGSTAAPTDVNPSSLINICGMGYDAADTTIQFMHNDGSGNASKIDLGAAFPKPSVDRTAVYEIAMFCPPGTTQELSYQVTDLVTGEVATGTVTTNLPATSTLLAPSSYVSVGGVSSVIGLMVSSLYLESDY
jgi:hypothetical protein